MLVQEAMTPDVRIVRPDQTIRDAARLMAEIDAGLLPVADGDRIIGMVTDRDIAVRAVAEGKSPKTKVRDVMTRDVKYCFADEDIDDVAGNMATIQVRRLPVMNREKRLVGIIALADIVATAGPSPGGRALEGISVPGGEHNQTMEATAS